MPSVDQNVRVLQDLAFSYVQQGQPQMRDRFLVLAVDAMYTAGRMDEAEKLRQRLLQANPHHLLKPFRSIAEAMKSTDVKNYVEGLRRTYPPEKAQQLLESMRATKTDKPTAEASDGPAPVVTMPSSSPEQLKIFGFQPEKHAPGAVSTSSPRNSSGARLADPAAPTSWRATMREVDGPDEMPGAWVATGLFWITLAAAAALVMYTLGRPFLPF